MTKNQKNTILITITILVIIILSIIIIGKTSKNWIDNILSADSYTIIMENCNNKKTTLSSEVLEEINKKWEDVSDNGPWTGDTNKCYDKVTISSDKNGVIEETEILLLDDNSLAIIKNNETRYYVNTKQINNYLNSLN